MTFRNVVIKNFTTHIRRYLAFFFCSSFTIMIFFIYSTILFNQSFMKLANKDGFFSLVYMSIVAVFLFSVFFINYAHSSFVKSRSNEFALFMTLGLTKKNISRIVLLENMIILLSSMVIGMLSGALFSRLFFMIISELIGEAPIRYELNSLSFLGTLLVFLVIYATAVLTSRRRILGLSIIKLMQSRKEGYHGKVRLLTAVIAFIVFLGSSVTMLFLMRDKHFSDKLYMYLVYAAAAFPSMYLLIAQGWNLYYHYRAKNKNRYYGKLLSDSEIEYSFASNRRILFVLSILSAMIIFFVASPISLYSLADRLSEGERTAQIEYAEWNGINSLEQGKLDQLLAESITPLSNAVDHEFLVLNCNNGTEEVQKPIISETLYKEINKKKDIVSEGEILLVITTLAPGYQEMVGMDQLTLYSETFQSDYRITGTVKGKGIHNKAFPSNITIVMNDADYNLLRQRIDEDRIGISHLFNFEDWKKTAPFTEGLRNSLQQISPLFQVDSFLEAYHLLRNIYAMMIFFTSFMGLLFFIAAGSIFIFKQYGDMTHLKESYQRLTKIGMTGKEFIRMQASSQKLIYFTPLILGTMIGLVFMYMTTFLLGGGYMVGVFFRNSILALVLYFISQMIFYLVSMERLKRSMFQEGHKYKID